jgi:hypothetical protein
MSAEGATHSGIFNVPALRASSIRKFLPRAEARGYSLPAIRALMRLFLISQHRHLRFAYCLAAAEGRAMLRVETYIENAERTADIMNSKRNSEQL